MVRDLREVDNGYEANERDNAGQYSLKDENPSPSGDPGHAATRCSGICRCWTVALTEIVARSVAVELHEAVA